MQLRLNQTKLWPFHNAHHVTTKFRHTCHRCYPAFINVALGIIGNPPIYHFRYEEMLFIYTEY